MTERRERIDFRTMARRIYAGYVRHGFVGWAQIAWHWLLSKPERLTAIATLAIFLATTFAAVVGIAQWRALHSTDRAIQAQVGILERQLAEMEATGKQTDELIAANKKLSDAAVKSAEIAEKALTKNNDAQERQLRAYIFVAPNNAYNVNAGGRLQTYVVIGNSGRSFAKKVERYISVRISDAPGPTIVDDINQVDREEGTPVFAPPVVQHLFRELPDRGLVSADDFTAIQTGEKRIYVFGTIFYEDIFGNAHKTEFCHMYFGVEMANDSRNSYLAGQAKYCATHNNAD